jgi:hypothetical protein
VRTGVHDLEQPSSSHRAILLPRTFAVLVVSAPSPITRDRQVGVIAFERMPRRLVFSPVTSA